MYGTVARLRINPGQEQAIRDLLTHWREVRGAVEGTIGGSLYQLDADPNIVIMTVAFRDKASYQTNAQSPEQDRFYRQMRTLLAEDPIWEDGEIVATF